jgi:hypothetical protein
VTKRSHQSVVAKNAAQSSIDNKLSVLKTWAENGIPSARDPAGREILDKHDRKVLEFFPTSIRQFKLWDGSQNSSAVRASFPAFKATGNDTLSKRPECEELARKAIAAIIARAQSQRLSGRTARIKELETEVRALECALRTRVSEIREQQRTIRHLRIDNDSVHAKLERERKEFDRLFSSISQELEAEKIRASQLAASLSKLTPFATVRAPRTRG